MKKIVTILVVLFCVIGITHSQGYKVIVNSKNSISSISKKELSQIFYKKKKKWDDGQRIEPVDLSSSSSVRADFTKNIHGKSVAAVRNYWQQAAFTGAGIAPVEKASDEEVVEYVKAHPGAIGYISGSVKTGDIKIITVQ
nr:substrate-binding domain-containing protein [uncultured Carboxylicivirga sp.]